MANAHEHILSKADKETYYYRGLWLQLIRPLTLTGTITPILVGTGLALNEGFFKVDVFIVYLITAVMIQMTINMLNDYFDFINGQDAEKWERTYENKQQTGICLKTIPVVAMVLIMVASIGGFWLAFMSHWLIIPVGAISIVAGIKYSAGKHSFASLAMGEVIAFVFLGVVVTTLAYAVQTKFLTIDIFIVSVLFGLLIATMILTNNIRDIEKDRPYRQTLAILLGRKKAVIVLSVQLIVLYLSVLCLAFINILGLEALLILFAIPFAGKLIYSFRKRASRAEEMLGMKWAAVHHFAYGMLFAIAVWL